VKKNNSFVIVAISERSSRLCIVNFCFTHGDPVDTGVTRMLVIIVIHFVTGEHKAQHLQKDNYKLHVCR